MTQDAGRASLLERIGGAAAVQAAVDLLYEKVRADAELEGLFRGRDVERIRRHQRLFLERLLAVPEASQVHEMERAHAGLAIEMKHFYRVSDHLVEALTQLGLEEDLIAEIVSAIAPLARGVVNTPEAPEYSS